MFLKHVKLRHIPLYRFGKYYFSTMNFKTIGTHNGTFHCDEVLGCSLLRILSKDADIIRSRDKNTLDKCDIVIDVGGEFNSKTNRFDHHQKEFNHTLNSLRPEKKFFIKLSSAGLVYCHFGEEIIKTIVGDLEEKLLRKVYDRVYEHLIQEVDAIDNGINICDGEMKYNIHTNLSSRIATLNKKWNEKNFNEEQAFARAMDITHKEFVEVVTSTVNIWLPAYNHINEAIDKRFSVHDSGEIIEFDYFLPWIEHFFDLEKEYNIVGDIKFIIYPDDTDASFRVRAVPITKSSFTLRKPLHDQWRGLRDKELEKLSPGLKIKFVHSSGFIGGNETKQGAIQMAAKSLS